MSHAMELVTAEELARYPHDDRRYELVEGRLVAMSPVSMRHAHVVGLFTALLTVHARSRGLGIVGPEIGFTLARNPDTVLAPDVGFVRRDRLPSPLPSGFVELAPDLAIEVLSHDDRPARVRNKVRAYLAHGARVVIIANPDARTVTIHRPLATPLTLVDADDIIDLDDVVPGFRCTLNDVFEE